MLHVTIKYFLDSIVVITSLFVNNANIYSFIIKFKLDIFDIFMEVPKNVFQPKYV